MAQCIIHFLAISRPLGRLLPSFNIYSRLSGMHPDERGNLFRLTYYAVTYNLFAKPVKQALISSILLMSL